MKVTARSLENLQVEIKAGSHQFVADEPAISGGEDAGPDPYDLLLSALAACKVMTAHMYAKRKEWPLESVEISLNIQKVYARDCAECASDSNAKVDIIETEVKFKGDLSPEQIERLAEIVDRCPVHRTLTNEVKIRTTVAT